MKVSALALVLAFAAVPLGCALGGPTIPVPPNQVVEDGFAAGVRWQLAYERNDDQDCLFVAYPDTSPRISGSCSDPVVEEGLIRTGTSDGLDVPTVFYGFVGPDVASIRVRITGAEQIVQPVPLTNGAGLKGFAAAFAPFARLIAIEALDAQGAVLDTQEAPR